MMIKRLVGLLILSLFVGASYAQKRKSKVGSGPSRVVYPKKATLDLDGLKLEGQLFQPGEFYFNYREKENFDSLVKRKPNFRKEMLRDVVLSK